MELNERQQNIINILREKGKISVVSLAKGLNYSEMTIRRDLTKMEKAGLLKRSHGMVLENDINFSRLPPEVLRRIVKRESFVKKQPSILRIK